ncbi:MAG: glycosyltransferase family 4 protein [Verrucomicrobia bacterium]|nr:glycosyltransferase family 4 protein [Verrucomicrobiota bacterium]MDA1087230.1 glycosyltransferase family 4 protein [Verrucomicrobiota bacterium]
MKHHVAVAVLGARLHYAAARALNDANALEQLYTDICAVRGWPSLLRSIWPASLMPSGLKALTQRVPEGISRSRVTTFDSFGLEYARRRRRARTASETTETYLWGGRTFAGLVADAGLGDANAVYAFNTAALELLVTARQRGVYSVLEQTIAPAACEDALLREEAERFPGWAPEGFENPDVEQLASRECAEWHASDHILCGSAFVRDALTGLGVPSIKITVVPYGLDVRPGIPQTPGPIAGSALRVLYVGAVGLRKGIGDLANAMGDIPENTASARAVGSILVTERARERIGRSVSLAGAAARSAMPLEYARSDVFVLPSICEGSALACYEAMAAGLPVITTPNAGSIVRDGIDGYIVPIRSPERIREHICELAMDDKKWREMSCNARRHVADHSLKTYGKRILSALDQHQDAQPESQVCND